MTHGLGWNPALERKHEAAFASMCRVAAPLPTDTPIPHEIDLRGKVPIRNQGPFGSCSGHARAKACGFANWIDVGKFVDLSPRFDYLTNRIVDGDEGPDAGASISGSALASRKYGECLESDFPYWKDTRFTTGIPQDALDKAQRHRILSVRQIHSTDEAIRAMGLVQGALVVGIDWTDSLANSDGIVTRISGRSNGGHALCVFGYVDRAGEKWPIMWNSHGSEWADKGTALIHPKVFDGWCSSTWGVYLLSDLQEYETRQFADFTGVGKGVGLWSKALKGL